MERDLRRDLALKLQKGVVGVGAGEDVKHVLDAIERLPAHFQRRNRVGEARRGGVSRDGGNLGLMPGKRARVSLAEMLGCDAVERSDPIGAIPSLEEGIGGRGRRGHMARFGHWQRS